MPKGEVGSAVEDALTLKSGESAGYLVRRAQQRHTRLWAEEFGGEVTGPQFAAATVIAAHPGLDQKSIGQWASLDKSSIADVVGRLQRGGWLEVGSSTDDGRRKALTVRPLARTALVELTRRAALVQAAVLAPLTSDHERTETVRLLQLVAFSGVVPPREADVHAPAGARVPLLTLHTAPGHLLRRALQVHTVLWGDEVDSLLSSPQYAVLNALAGYPEGLDQTSTSEQTSLDKSTLAVIVDRLVAREWVARRRHPQDGRRRVLTITDAARAELDRLSPAVSRVQARLLQPLPAAERLTFLSLIRRIAYAETPTPPV